MKLERSLRAVRRGNKLTAVNPVGFRRFVAMVHARGMKILAYASSGYFTASDPDYRRGMVAARRRPQRLVGPALLAGKSGLAGVFSAADGADPEDYQLDGLYNDWGYIPNADKRIKEPAQDEMAVFRETPEYDECCDRPLYLIYSEVKRAAASTRCTRTRQRASHRGAQGLRLSLGGRERPERRRPAEGDEEPHAARCSLHPGDGSQDRGGERALPAPRFPRSFRCFKAGGL